MLMAACGKIGKSHKGLPDDGQLHGCSLQYSENDVFRQLGPMWKVSGGNIHHAGASKDYKHCQRNACNCPSFRESFVDLPIFPHAAISIRADKAVRVDRFFIFIILKVLGEKKSFDNISLQV